MNDRAPGMLSGTRERELELKTIGDELAALYHAERGAETVGDEQLARALHDRRVDLEARRLRVLWDRRRVPRPRPGDAHTMSAPLDPAPV